MKSILMSSSAGSQRDAFLHVLIFFFSLVIELPILQQI